MGKGFVFKSLKSNGFRMFNLHGYFVLWWFQTLLSVFQWEDCFENLYTMNSFHLNWYKWEVTFEATTSTNWCMYVKVTNRIDAKYLGSTNFDVWYHSNLASMYSESPSPIAIMASFCFIKTNTDPDFVNVSTGTFHHFQRSLHF